MLNWISWFLISLLTIISETYIYSQILNVKIPKVNLKNILFLLLIAILSATSSLNWLSNIKVIFNLLLLVFYFKIIFKGSITKCMAMAFLLSLFMAISEIILILLLKIFSIDISDIPNHALTNFSINAIAVMIRLGLFSIKVIKKIIRNIINWYEDKQTFSLILLILASSYAIFSILFENSREVQSIAEFIISDFVLIILIVLVIIFLREKTEKTKITAEYDNLLDYVKTYENLFDLQVKDLHEFKNQLIIIRDMANTKKLKDYITNLINDREKNLTDITTEKLKYMPSGGLKGLLIFKTQKMKSLNLNYYIDVDENFKNKEVVKACDKHLKDISRIIGIFIDNAIDAASKTDDKYLIIEARYEKKKIKFSVSNSFQGKIDFQSLESEGYSTKGPGRGYGLSLVKQILKQNKNLTNVKEINSKFFVQHLIITTKTNSK